MLALELDDIEVDQEDVRTVLVHHLFDRFGELFEIFGEVGAGEHLVELQLRIDQPLPVDLDQALVDGVLVGKVMVDVADRQPGPFGDLAQGRGAIALGGEQREAGIEDGLDGRLRLLELPFLGRHRSASLDACLKKKTERLVGKDVAEWSDGQAAVRQRSGDGGAVGGARVRPVGRDPGGRIRPTHRAPACCAFPGGGSPR